MTSSARLRISGLLVITVAVAWAAVSDETHGPRFLEQSQRPPRRDGPKSDIRIDVQLTLVPVTVTDRFGRVVSGLERDNFSVFDEKLPRDIVFFSREDAPASVGLVFDSSGSMKPVLETAQDSVRSLMETLNPEDQTLAVTVSSRPDLVSGFTRDVAEIQNALLFSKAKGKTALIDGIYLALDRVRGARNPRKAIVVVSDGVDNNSRYTFDELLRFAVEADAQIYTIGVHGPAVTTFDAAEAEAGDSLLKTLSQRTGGVHFRIGGPFGLPGAMASIAKAIHNLYVLGYYPPDDVPPGKFRRIRVKLNMPEGTGKLQVYARHGYYTSES